MIFVLQFIINSYTMDKNRKGVIMSQATVSFRMDSKLKKNMDETCKKMGMTMTSAFTIFANKVVNEQRIPFEICNNPYPNIPCIDNLTSEELDKEIRKGLDDIKAGRVVSHDELMKEMNELINNVGKN